MGTMEKKLSYLLGTKNAIKEAIVSKGVKVTEDTTFRDYASKIREIVGTEYYVPSKTSKGGVDFYDYDGGILHTYTKEEFLALSEMPALPERPRLVCQGWNYSLEDAKANLEELGYVSIGATYITDDGKTRLYMSVDSKVSSEITLYFSLSSANGLVIDWGDGVKEAVSGTGAMNAIHKYEEIGDYVISLEVAEGCVLELSSKQGSSSSYTPLLGTNRVYCNMLKKVEVGSGVTSIGSQAFYFCYSLSSVVIPQGVTKIDNSAFSSCSSLVVLDFSELTSVPKLSSASSIPSHAELRIVVPDDLYDTWIAATNWSSFASKIVKASEFNA